jgi:type IV pilus assembly protein PilC
VALYTYKAIDANGKSVLGRIDAGNVFDLEQRLSRMGLDLVSGAPTAHRSRLVGGSGVGRQDLINFCFHLEQLASAGVPLVE